MPREPVGFPRYVAPSGHCLRMGMSFYLCLSFSLSFFVPVPVFATFVTCESDLKVTVAVTLLFRHGWNRKLSYIDGTASSRT